MPNQDHIIAGGLEWECPPIIPFIDNVSRNSTKQWNVHYCSYASNAALPRSKIEKEANIHFVVTSPHTSPMELIQAINDVIKKTGGTTPLKVWHGSRGCFILLRPWILFLPGDNLMQAELCSHVGLNGNFFCRCCNAGGMKEYKSSNEGFSKLMMTGELCDSAETRRQVIAQLQLAAKAAAAGPLKKSMTSSGVKDSLAAPERKAVPVADVNHILEEELRKFDQEKLINPLLSVLDTPVEALHTHLLGIVKYFWAQTAGLKIPNIMADYMCRYRGGLIGKHFKTISQVMDVRNAWLAIGRLTVLIWETDICDLEAFIIELESVITDCSPNLLVTKPKFHIICHLPFHICCFGPAILFSMEHYESFNHVFHLCSIYSNRLAPSCDIGTTFADLDGRWICVGQANNREAALLGLSAPNPPCPGCKSSTNGKSVARAMVHAQCPYPERNEYDTWIKAESIVAVAGDNANVGDMVICLIEGVCALFTFCASFLTGPYTIQGEFSPHRFRRIIVILCDESRKSVLVTTQIFSLGNTLHSHLHIPTLSKSLSHHVLMPLVRDIDTTLSLY
ncbi:hypothetical protein FIBSPDRAFT_907278 [Athelia psychrophila]|uniref:Uncharacterized protein n=1 Tax=Athelia psychrophila TaxID=1759441 RepID=A0A166VFZ3_9AGAM|nr:hypothetical protein FIBSPDRAFT_907278 [Fibularhizoctonia sp. CBS 109695]